MPAIDFTEEQWVITWMCVAKMVENYEKYIKKYDDSESEKEFLQKLKGIGDKIHREAFPLLHRLAEEGKIDENILTL